MKRLSVMCLLMLTAVVLCARTYYMAPSGNDKDKGSISAPFATFSKAQSLLMPGDTLFIRGGVYKVRQDEMMRQVRNYAAVFYLGKSGKDETHRICYFGYPGERPVFDLSEVKPSGLRVSGFYVDGSFLHFRNFEVVGIQVTISTHTQSENISARGGSHNIFENLSMHDGMGIGLYLTEGSNNLILNCDAYNNYDSYSEGGKGGNADGFGGHPIEGCRGNVFRGCRAWYNSDDGFDLIRAQESVTIDSCWAFLNGYKPGTTEHAADGNGIKGGGYGMSVIHSVPAVIPRHFITNCIAFGNEANGFYANHHLGGNEWINNVSVSNKENYRMVNRRSESECVDVPGYEHHLKGNISFHPRERNGDFTMVDSVRCKLENNVVISSPDSKYASVTAKILMQPRRQDGSLPPVNGIFPKTKSSDS
jgi:hypothetical protein